MHLAIIGAGAFGSALGKVLKENGHTFAFFDPKKFPKISLESALEGAGAVLFVAPSNTAEKTLKLLPKDLPLICASKGFLSDRFFKDFKSFSIISGASFACDLERSFPITFTVSSVYVKNLFQTDWLSFEVTHDNLGILLCGSLKNIYAISAGFRGIRPATPEFRTFLIDALNEMKLVLKANGCDKNTANLSCGFKDLALTASSEHSRNYRLGKALRNSKKSTKEIAESLGTVEGLNALNSLSSSDLNLPEELPLLKEIFVATRK